MEISWARFSASERTFAYPFFSLLLQIIAWYQIFMDEVVQKFLSVLSSQERTQNNRSSKISHRDTGIKLSLFYE